MNKNILNIVVITLIGSILFFAGCVEEESTISTETPTITASPTSALEQEMKSPTSTPEASWEPNVTLKPGYKWYQDDEFGYGFGYPENYNNLNLGLSEGQKSGVAFGLLDPDGPPKAQILVLVYSDLKEVKWWDEPDWVEMGGLEKAKELGIVYEYGNITINERKGFQLVYDPLMLMGSKMPTMKLKTVIFTIDDLNYVIMAFANTPEGDLYNKYEGTFDDIINSFVIRE